MCPDDSIGNPGFSGERGNGGRTLGLEVLLDVEAGAAVGASVGITCQRVVCLDSRKGGVNAHGRRELLLGRS